MTHKWIIDVLTDLKTFAAHNDLPALAAQLEDAQLVASVEMSANTRDGVSASKLTHSNCRTDPFGAGARFRA
ncbi:MAG: hypothetical protein AAF891_05285 [Pseudomonadota bacterium]